MVIERAPFASRPNLSCSEIQEQEAQASNGNAKRGTIDGPLSQGSIFIDELSKLLAEANMGPGSVIALRDADKAMYQAKLAGRNTIRFWGQ